jgi:hypothetical protein
MNEVFGLGERPRIASGLDRASTRRGAGRRSMADLLINVASKLPRLCSGDSAGGVPVAG